MTQDSLIVWEKGDVVEAEDANRWEEGIQQCKDDAVNMQKQLDEILSVVADENSIWGEDE